MTQSGPTKKPQAEVKKEEPKSEMQILLERLREEKPAVYDQYVAAVRQKRPVWVYPDLTVRIG